MTFLKKIYWFLFIYDLTDSSAETRNKIEEPWKKRLMRDASYLILFSYVLLIFNPVIPIFADKIAHTFWEEEHLITVHKIYGGNHVHQETDRAVHQADKEKSTGNSKSYSEEYVHLVSYLSFNFSNDHFVKQFYPSYISVLSIFFPEMDDKPPKI